MLGSGLSALASLPRQLQDGINLPQITPAVRAGGNSTQTLQTGGDEGQKRLLCLCVPQNLILKEQLGGKPSSVAGSGEGFQPNISPAYELCQLLGGLQNLPTTLGHKERERSGTALQPIAGGQEFGSQQGWQGQRGRCGTRGTSSCTCSFR